MVEEKAQFEWKVSDDRLSVLLKAPPPKGVASSPFETAASSVDPLRTDTSKSPQPTNGEFGAEVLEITRLLKANRIVSRVDPDAVINALRNPTGAWVIIARGIPPTRPTDAKLEYLVDLDNPGKPTIAQDSGRVDYKKLNLILNVKRGQELIRKHKSIPGEPGLDVYGKLLPPKEPLDVAIPPGKGLEISEDGLLAVAAVDGAITTRQTATIERRRGNRGKAVKLFKEEIPPSVEASDRNRNPVKIISVTRLHRVTGDVAYQTGNIDFNGSVEINGNVLSGFEVRAVDDIVVRGVVEGAHLEAGGSIKIARGVQGAGKGVLKAGERISARFANDARLEAGTVIELTTHLLNCDVTAGEAVLVAGARGLIAGGEIRAGHLIRANVAGSDLGVKTLLQLGLFGNLNQLIRGTEDAIEEETIRLANLEEELIRQSQMREELKTVPKELEALRIRLVRDQFKAMKKLDTLNRDLIDYQVQREQARLGRAVVKETAYPGVVIRYPGGIYSVGHAIHHVEFYFEEGEVRTRAV